MEDMLREDQEYQTLAGANLDQAIIPPETIVQSLAATKNETTSVADVDTDNFKEPNNSYVGEKSILV